MKAPGYLVRVLLVRLVDGEKPVVTSQHSAEYDNEDGALSLFQDLLAEMPLPEVQS
jgi:hypothetical protein